MPKTNDSINRELDDLLSGLGFETTYLDSSGEELPIPDEADVMQFHFHADGQEYGTVTVSIDGLEQMIIYYDDRVADSPDQVEEGISWFDLLKKLKRFSLNHQLGFKLEDSDRLRKDMKKRNHLKKVDESAQSERTLLEGYWGNRTTSWSDPNPHIKIVIKHNRRLEEDDARFRYIEKIFLENQAGERVLVPSTRPSHARMFARHLAEGGQYRDERWLHLGEICEDIGKLGGFIRATRGRREQFNEGVQSVIGEAEAKYGSLRESVKQLQTSRGYNRYFEDWKPAIMEGDGSDMTEHFASNRVDHRIEAALPVLAKYDIRVRELNETQQLESWAESMIAEFLDPDISKLEDLEALLNDDELELGPDAINAISSLEDIIENDDLYAELKNAADIDPNRDARPVIISWMSRQDNPKYDRILDRIESDSGEEGGSAEPTTTKTPPADKSKNVEPAKVKPAPAKPKSDQPAAPGPQLPDLGMLPPLPPLAEDDISRIIKLSGIRK